MSNTNNAVIKCSFYSIVIFNFFLSQFEKTQLLTFRLSYPLSALFYTLLLLNDEESKL